MTGQKARKKRAEHILALFLLEASLAFCSRNGDNAKASPLERVKFR